VMALSLISADDPPVMMTYGMAPDDPLPADPKKVSGWQVHHVMFGVKLKERMDALGVEAHLHYPRAKTKYPDLVAFIIDRLGRK
jgi:acetyl esterase